MLESNGHLEINVNRCLHVTHADFIPWQTTLSKPVEIFTHKILSAVVKLFKNKMKLQVTYNEQIKLLVSFD